MSHGIATLAAAGHIPDEAAVRPAALLRTGVAALLAGSAHLPAASSTAATGTRRKAASRRSGSQEPLRSR
jgi:hypothetical protein